MPSDIPKDAYVLIIGAMKAGTTTLYNYLRLHPEICAPDVKEPEYFTSYKGDTDRYNRYEDIWAQVPERTFDPNKHKFVLEASTGGTKYPNKLSGNAPKRIYEYGIRPKFIYILRNPFDRIASHYNFMQNDPEWGVEITDNYLISISNYYVQLNRYLKYFPEESFLLLNFEDLKKNPEVVVTKICTFLNISAEFEFKENVKNKTRVHSKLEKKIRNSWMGGLTKLIPQPVKEYAKEKFKVPKRELTSEERKLIFEKLKDDMHKLQNEYGIDVQKWGFN